MGEGSCPGKGKRGRPALERPDLGREGHSAVVRLRCRLANSGLCNWLGDLAHRIVEGEAEHLDKEVDGVASEVALRPAPVAVFEEQAFVSRQFEVAGGQLDELEAAFLEQGDQRSHAGGADLLARPAILADGHPGSGIKGAVYRSHCANGVE